MKTLWIITMLWLPVDSDDYAFVTLYQKMFQEEQACYEVAETLKRTKRFNLRAVCHRIEVPGAS